MASVPLTSDPGTGPRSCSAIGMILTRKFHQPVSNGSREPDMPTSRCSTLRAARVHASFHGKRNAVAVNRGSESGTLSWNLPANQSERGIFREGASNPPSLNGWRWFAPDRLVSFRVRAGQEWR